MDEIYKEVYYNQYCKICKYENLNEAKDPCNDCLDYPVNAQSHKPVGWKEKQG